VATRRAPLLFTFVDELRSGAVIGTDFIYNTSAEETYEKIPSFARKVF
jgi:hypothetical protein